MDSVFEPEIINTAKVLKFERLLGLKFKYNNFSFHSPQDVKSSTTVEVFFHYTSAKEIGGIETNFSYHISESFLTFYGWQKAPDIVKICSKKELESLEGLNQEKELKEIFDYNWLKSLLICPIFNARNPEISRPITLGLLVVENKHNRRWQAAETEVVKWMAKQIATAMINQQTLAKVQSLVQERTSQLQVSLEVQAKLGQKLRKYVEELRKANQMKEQFIASLSDALKTPLANMKMGIKMLKLINKEERIANYLEILAKECDKEIALVENLLNLQNLRENKLTIYAQKISWEELLQNLANNFRENLQEKQLELVQIIRQKHIYSDFNILESILKELLQNAIKFSEEKTKIFLEILPEESSTVIRITNCGSEISQKEQERLFTPFYQGERVANVTNSGTGLGLALVKLWVDNLNGAITVSSVPKVESGCYQNTFTITLPNVGKE
ncbi:MAG: HAMP domain-containing histidine kinase [Geminocystis sp.]|nr:HAMP domain-containing histidine kinase [Geminocystis sp.]HIK37348.1 HAMP domain-containing histidine kinase [Geminocystis sp. M7585_C2015_104]MCS7148305.1 HAMP domain-containing histidine kinase [Geminocystis sp.]MCX8077720.1 HAMP domain-containing histidine kinase [Geminocystis sp.]MDW8116612.1 HAMP domain-containing sensor histidine kinase [Geminocystis sp.]